MRASSRSGLQQQQPQQPAHPASAAPAANVAPGASAPVGVDAEDLWLFDTPPDLVCPITLQLFKASGWRCDRACRRVKRHSPTTATRKGPALKRLLPSRRLQEPVITAAGQVYERAAIETHLAVRGPTDPLTNAPLVSAQLIPVYTLKGRSFDFRETVAKACVDKVWAAAQCRAADEASARGGGPHHLGREAPRAAAATQPRCPDCGEAAALVGRCRQGTLVNLAATGARRPTACATASSRCATSGARPSSCRACRASRCVCRPGSPDVARSTATPEVQRTGGARQGLSATEACLGAAARSTDTCLHRRAAFLAGAHGGAGRCRTARAGAGAVRRGGGLFADAPLQRLQHHGPAREFPGGRRAGGRGREGGGRQGTAA